MAERIHKRGKPWLRFTCDCGQRQESSEPDSGIVTCARCGEEHTADG